MLFLDGTVVYTDGSYDKRTKQCGYAAVILSDHNPDYMEVLYGGTSNPDATVVWNIGGEILAVYYALQYLASISMTEAPIHIYHDYIYLDGWANQTAKRNKPMTQWYSAQVEEFRKKYGTQVLFHHVKAHSGNPCNEFADLYAKKGVGYADNPEPYHISRMPIPPNSYR